MPMNACAPILQNWCTPVKPLRITQSPTCTWPASVALLENTQWLPTTAVVRDMRVGQQPVVVADAGDAAAVAGATVDGDEFADQVAVADDQFGAFAVEFLVLRVAADRGMTEDAVVAADARAGR